MITLTIPAAQALAEQFAGKGPRSIRIYLEDMGCSSMKLALGVDKLRDGDRTLEHGDITLLINQDLSDAVGTVTIDSGQFGFNITSEKSVSGSGCGG